MKKIGLLGFVIVAAFTLSQSAQGGPRERSEGYYFPSASVYDSLGREQTVHLVQRALTEDGYYVGDHRGNFCFETRVAVRRYQRDNGLPITGKIDDALLKALRLR
jgi:peptidoglycan hydrolase-like protein with peptidoglycan-binding domain